jgi:uncharacterized protein (TIGR00252 family)
MRADSSVILSGMQTKSHDTTTARGREAEALAARYLECCGLRVVERNFLVRGGEIDLICRDGKTLVFVEVRQRSRSDFGGAGPASRRPSAGASSSPPSTIWPASRNAIAVSIAC